MTVGVDYLPFWPKKVVRMVVIHQNGAKSGWLRVVIKHNQLLHHHDVIGYILAENASADPFLL